jgi:hypothetical protein
MFIIPLTMTDSLQRLKMRRSTIALEIGNLNERILALKSEDKNLELAETILAQFEDDDGVVRPAEPSESTTISMEARGKPLGTPTTPAMIMQLLNEAARQGKPGMEPKDMQLSIARRWWPGVKSEDVAPTAWRMWKDGRLSKDGSVYSIKQPPKNEGWAAPWTKTKAEA